jgi:hypothetical protein
MPEAPNEVKNYSGHFFIVIIPLRLQAHGRRKYFWPPGNISSTCPSFKLTLATGDAVVGGRRRLG